MKVNRNVTHELFTTVKVNEVIVEPGDTVKDLLLTLDELAWSAKVVEVDNYAKGQTFANGAVSLIFGAIA